MQFDNSIPWISAEPAGRGLAVQIAWDDDHAVLRLTMPRVAQAAPGIAHGGFLSAIADHVMGFVAAQRTGRPVATRQMVVDYLAPTPTSAAMTIRAWADDVGDRDVAVSLQCVNDRSGKITFKARGTYARVSPARRSAGAGDADYDTLEERFDPSQVLAWLTTALAKAYRPGVVSRPVLIAVDVRDANPRLWTVSATADSLSIEAGDPAEWDVRFTGNVRAWRELVYRAKTADQLIDAGLATIEDPDGVLPVFLGSLGV